MATTEPVTAPPSSRPADTDKPLAELLAELSSDVSELVTTHVELAKVEIKEEARKAGVGAGLLGAAGVAALLALTLLSFAAAWGLSELVPEGVAFLIVGVLWTAAAGVLAVTGRERIARTRAPEKTIEEVKEDAQWVRQQTS